MSHFRDRVITTPNLPQLPSGRRAIINVPVLNVSVGTAVAADVNIYTINAPSVSLPVPTQTKTATSP